MNISLCSQMVRPPRITTMSARKPQQGRDAAVADRRKKHRRDHRDDEGSGSDEDLHHRRDRREEIGEEKDQQRAKVDQQSGAALRLGLRGRAHSGRQSGNGAGDGARVEGPQVVGFLADPDGVDRKAEFLRRRDQDPAARGSVELGHDEAGHARALAEHLDLSKGILSGGRVEHEQRHRAAPRG